MVYCPTDCKKKGMECPMEGPLTRTSDVECCEHYESGGDVE
ncbi:hypothetical protein LCGC14_0370230 [marine sediment metagenome]|uniref:Uncharacterized protein n=1 Tax=marine sediment metagenome TaxID=412755 RepID=A0A0F9TBF6_9ZZZZ